MSKFLRNLIPFLAVILLIGTLSTNSKFTVHAQEAETLTPEQATSTPSPTPLTPADVINAVNALRIANGLNALSIHPVLMEVASLQASALAATEGTIGHQRPCGMTLGQQLLVMGFPLWGDLSLDGYRSENWVAAMTVEQVMTFWQGDDLHLNTMISPHRSHIGAAVVLGDQYYVVLETALSTNTGQHQSTAYDILTGIPMTQTMCAGFASGEISDYSIPIALSTARPDGDVVHEVQYGQTLWSLAELYKVPIEQIKLLNGLVDNNIIPGWKLLIQKAATQPPPVTDTPLVLVTPTETKYPTAIPFYTKTPTVTATVQSISVGQQLSGNSTVVAALLIAFSFLLAGIIGFGRKKVE